jgi:hypothetical protein
MPLPRLSVTRAFGLVGALIIAISQSPNQHPRAQCGPNPIVCENLNAGSPPSDWDINVNIPGPSAGPTRSSAKT